MSSVLEMVMCKVSSLVPAHALPNICWTKMYEYYRLELFLSLLVLSVLKVLELFFQWWQIGKTIWFLSVLPSCWLLEDYIPDAKPLLLCHWLESLCALCPCWCVSSGWDAPVICVSLSSFVLGDAFTHLSQNMILISECCLSWYGKCLFGLYSWFPCHSTLAFYVSV